MNNAFKDKAQVDSQKVQKNHFENIAALYEAHYYDSCSQKYRQKFINQPLLAAIELRGRNVLEAMCGSGQTTEYLLSRGANVTALDISQNLINSFRRRWPQCQAICSSIFNSHIADNAFDCVIVVGGLHHLFPNINEAIDEIYKILKPGGYLCFMEPHKGSLPSFARRIWYKIDKFVGKNEEDIDIEKLKNRYTYQFNFIKEKYSGSIAYLLVLNSMMFRIPLALKPLYTPFFLFLESIIDIFLTKSTSCFVLCQWQKK